MTGLTVGRTTKTTKTGLPIGLFSQEEKIDEKEESENDDDDDDDLENTNENTAEVDMPSVNGRLDRIEEMLTLLLKKSTSTVESKKAVDK